ncbi:protein GPR108-like [Carcharodon carcharias]|uniref:protein GPR108-like n=1 Tax=Carcharodon carcharias TaxID=13397 RepID=UPI001B7E9C6F|nr:protein GPR108-like [Carcharodon carcharias]
MMMAGRGTESLYLVLLLLVGVSARFHRLTLKGDTRSRVHLNTFGFYTNGTLDVNLTSLRINTALALDKIIIGFSLSKTKTDGVAAYTVDESTRCLLEKYNTSSGESLTLFVFDLIQNKVLMKKQGQQKKLSISGPDDRKNSETQPAANVKKDNDQTKDKEPKDDQREKNDKSGAKSRRKRESSQSQNKDAAKGKVEPAKEPKKTEKIEEVFELQHVNDSYIFNFFVKILSPAEEGLYTLSFHNCHKAGPGKKNAVAFDMTIEIMARNPKNYLSAGETPLPLLYLVMSGFFFVAALFWVSLLLKHRSSVFKIHWLMAALAFTKSISILFHAINYYFIAVKGSAIEGWAVMYYITHLLKGALLFITLALIGTGWAFVKYILSDKDKKIFMIVIPLQVLANTAYIIIESTEEGTSEYALWKEILFLVDLICCGAILFPVVWSIRHLQEASSTDGKAAMNLAKLKLFRHFYVMIVCYIYFTRIIAILLKFTVPFQWQWMYNFLVEVSTLVFFVLTGYKFRPASNNPYLQLPQDEEDVTMDEVVTESGLLASVTRVKKSNYEREQIRDSSV